MDYMDAVKILEQMRDKALDEAEALQIAIEAILDDCMEWEDKK